jgi:serine/threonine-protein kinase
MVSTPGSGSARESSGEEERTEVVPSVPAPPPEPIPPAVSTDPKDLIGKIVNGKYEVLSILGEGGMGIVYKVRHLILQHRNIFALKVIHPRFSANPSFQTRFLREVEIAMELTHENIIQIRDFGVTEQNLLFYTMDFFPGETLKVVIEKSGAMAAARATAIVKQVLLALAEAHKAGIVHRDLKPENVLIEALPGGTDKVRILDFGIAKLLEGEDESNLTQLGALGTPKYMSPEQASEARIDARSDLYSLGIIFYEMLVGRVPISGGTARSILLSHITVPPRPFKEARPDLNIPERTEGLVFHLLEKDREARPESAEEVLALLASGRTGWVSLPAQKVKRFRGARWAGVALLALVAAAALEHFVPWRRIFSSRADAEAESPGGSQPTRVEPPPRGAAAIGTGARTGETRPRRLRCAVCRSEYALGEKVGDMCHGEPLLEVEE